jgi:hypothetical protein
VSRSDADEDSSVKYQDYLLREYEIADFGATVTLNKPGVAHCLYDRILRHAEAEIAS